MYGSSLALLTDLGSTGNKFLPPAFCQSEKDRDLKVVIPSLPKFFPFLDFFSCSFIFFHCSLEMPEGMYSMLRVAWLEAPVATCAPEKEELVEKAAAEEVTARTPTAMAETDFIFKVYFFFNKTEAGCCVEKRSMLSTPTLDQR